MEISNIIKIGNRKKEHYNGLLMKADVKLHEHLTEAITAQLPKGSTILDLGAGEGALSQRLQDMGYKVIAVDINEEDFKAKSVIFKKCDFNSKDELTQLIHDNSEKFDGVLGVEVIEHLENPWEYIRTLKSLIRPGGYIFISTPNITSWYARLVFMMTGNFPSFINPDDCGHINPVSEWELGVIVKKSGLNLTCVKPAGTLPYIWINSSILKTFLNLLFLPLFPFMRGTITGWCKIFVIKK